MKAVSLIYGRDSATSNPLNMVQLADAFRHGGCRVTEAWRNTQRRQRDDVADALDETFGTGDRPLIFGILNGRDFAGADSASAAKTKPQQRADIPAQPQFLNGHPIGVRDLLRSIVEQAKQTGKPADVFLLVASRPNYLQHYARQMPEGSTLIAVHTRPSSRGHSTFWQTVQEPLLHGAASIGARDLLNLYLINNGPVRGLPQIAVSGRPARDMNDAWEYYTQNSQQMHTTIETQNAANHFQQLMPFLPLDAMRGVATARRHLERSDQETPIPHGTRFAGATQAWVLQTLWDDLFGKYGAAPLRKFASGDPEKIRKKPKDEPSSQIQAVVRRRRESATGDKPQQTTQPAPATRHRPQLSQVQVANLWQPGKKPWQQHPAVIKRLLHRG